jgi:hypothetical protein
MTMLTPAEIDRFHTFGFLVLRGWFTSEEAAALRGEVVEELARQYPDAAPDPGRRLFCSMFDQRLACFAGLISDQRFLAVAEQLHGPTLPVYSEANRYHIGDTPWHADLHPSIPDAIDTAGIKFIHYLEPLTASSGALRVIPGSHRQPMHGAVKLHLANHAPAIVDLPAVACETNPGDVVVFHHALFHASAHVRTQRHMHDLAYYPYPASETAAEHLRAALRNQIPPTRESMQWHGDWFTSAWIREAAVDPVRRKVVALMQSAGIFEAVGADAASAEWALHAADETAKVRVEDHRKRYLVPEVGKVTQP